MDGYAHNVNITLLLAELYIYHLLVINDSFFVSSFSPSLRTNESDAVIKHKVKVILQRIQSLKVCFFNIS